MMFIFLSILWIEFKRVCFCRLVRAEALMDDVVVVVGGWGCNLCALFLFHFPKTLIFSFLLSSHCHGSKGHLTFLIFSPRRNVFLMLLLLVPLTFTHLPPAAAMNH